MIKKIPSTYFGKLAHITKYAQKIVKKDVLGSNWQKKI